MGCHLRLRTPSTCDRAMESSDKKRGEKLYIGESPENKTLGESTSHFDLPQCREEDCTTTMRRLVAGADFNCRLVDWGYNDDSLDGECLAGWARNRIPI